MEERQRSGEFDLGHGVAAEVSQRIRSILGEAEAAAAAMRHEAEEEAQQRLRAADDEARGLVADAQRKSDALVQERIRWISERSDALLDRTDRVVRRLEQAELLRGQLAELADALGSTAEEIAREWAADATTASGTAPEPEPPAVTREPEPEPPFDEFDDAEPVDAIVEPAQAEDESAFARGLELRVVADADAGVDRREPPEAGAEDAAQADEQLAARLVALQMAVAGGNRAEVEGHLRRAFDLDAPEPILDDVFGHGSPSETRIAWPEAAGDANR